MESNGVTASWLVLNINYQIRYLAFSGVLSRTALGCEQTYKKKQIDICILHQEVRMESSVFSHRCFRDHVKLLDYIEQFRHFFHTLFSPFFFSFLRMFKLAFKIGSLQSLSF